MQDQAFMLIADISGYTEFFTQTEIDHAEGVVSDLLSIIIEHTKKPLIICEIEGDAVFSYAEANVFKQKQTLIEMIENIYFEFHSKLENIDHNTSCSCKACALVPSLDLKFVLHFGPVQKRHIKNHFGISGKEVITVHRMLKNTIRETHKLAAYLFISDNSLRALGINQNDFLFSDHSENYEHIGEIIGYVYDLKTYLKKKKESLSYIVNKKDTWFNFEYSIDSGAAELWEILTKAEYKQQWLEADSVTVTGAKNGRIGIGSENHCAHGKQVISFKIIDWKPFNYFSQEIPVPFGGVLRDTNFLKEENDQTNYTLRVSKPIGKNFIHSYFLRIILLPMKFMLKRALKKSFKIIELLATKNKITIDI